MNQCEKCRSNVGWSNWLCEPQKAELATLIRDETELEQLLEKLDKIEGGKVDKAEVVRRPVLHQVAVFVIVLLPAGLAGFFDSFLGYEPPMWWEWCAILNTLFLGLCYFDDLTKYIGDPELFEQKSIPSFLVGAGFLVVVVSLVSAIVVLGSSGIGSHVDPYYRVYLLLLLLSFGSFMGLDAYFAYYVKVYAKVREYWAVMLFVDLPTVIAFGIVVIYEWLTSRFGEPVDKGVLAGAVVMQMLIADTLFLIIGSNVHYWCLDHFSGYVKRNTPPPSLPKGWVGKILGCAWSGLKTLARLSWNGLRGIFRPSSKAESAAEISCSGCMDAERSVEGKHVSPSAPEPPSGEPEKDPREERGE